MSQNHPLTNAMIQKQKPEQTKSSNPSTPSATAQRFSSTIDYPDLYTTFTKINRMKRFRFRLNSLSNFPSN